MSDDMGEKIKQIADMLGGQNSNTNIPDNLKGILNMFMSNTSSSSTSSDDDTPADEEPKKSRSSEQTIDNNDDMADMARKMKKAMGMLNTGNDHRTNLLNAIKPYLNKNRQKKLQTCMKLMKIGSLTKILDDSEERPG